MAHAIVESSWAKLTSAIQDGAAPAPRHPDLTSDLRKMLEALDVVRPLLEEAERRSLLKEALRIRNAAVRICDLVDELHHDSWAPADGKVRRTLPLLAVVPMKNKRANNMKAIVDELRKIHREFGRSDSASLEQAGDLPETTPEVDEEMILGRDKAKRKIMNVLSASIIKEGPVILPIFGFEGIGKTALAQIIFKDSQFRKCNFRAWFHVSHKFDLLKIAKSMLFRASGEESPGSAGLEHIVNRLHELYHGMEVIIVLDDLREEDSNGLERLKSMLSIGGSKVIVIVTTRSKSIASTICTVKPHMVNPLSHSKCWAIIKQTSGFECRPIPDKQQLKMIGQKIARKCAGLPSAAQVLGRILCNKDIIRWSTALNSDVWNNDVTGMPHCVDILPKKNLVANQIKTMKTKLRMIEDELNQSVSDIPQQGAIAQQDIDPPKTTPQVEEERILGRSADKQRVMATLSLSNNREGPIILPIFGLGGVGKTTLAQVVYKDTQFKQYDFRVWIHASLKFDLLKIGRSMLFHASGEERHGSNDVEYTMSHLQDIYQGMKVLVVLDGLWDLDSKQLKELKSFLLSVGEKSTEVAVIVTTCSEGVARGICTVEPHKLNPLSDDMCCAIIKQRNAIKDGSDKEERGQKIASMCGGLPSAAIVLGSLLGSKDPVGWSDMMKSDIWSSISSSSSGTRFFVSSYKSMPPYLKLCFAYCAIFPKGHIIAKHDLIHQWIVLHLIEPSENVSTTQQHAEEYIKRLLDISFLQSAKSALTSGKDGQGTIMFTMHDIVHSFAVAMCEVIVPDAGMGISDWNQHCPYALLTNSGVGQLKLSNILHAQLRAIRCNKMDIGDDLFSFLGSLRVLELKESPMHKLPHSICRLQHLGYLNLSGCSQLVALPLSLGDLINLVHIDLSDCFGLSQLPETLGNLLNLSHIGLSRCHGLVGLPGSLEKLKKLVHLDMSFWSCFEGIPVLGGLTSLQHLNLSHPCCYLPEHRSHLKLLKDVLFKLTNLQYLNLSMCLNPIFYCLSEEGSLKYIQSCINRLSSLEHLDLSHNTFLFDLPESQDGLNKLYTLDLSSCIRLKRVHEWMGKMDFLNIKNCKGLESCHFTVQNDGSSSSLVQLEDVNCKKLDIICLERVKSMQEVQTIGLSKKQNLRQLKLDWTVGSQGSVEQNALLGQLVPPHTVERLVLHGYNRETCLPAWWTSSILSNLVEVTMEDFPSCRRLPPFSLLPKLKCVVLKRMVNITRIDTGGLSSGSKASFHQLDKFTLEDMQCLEQFNTTYHSGGEVFMFPPMNELFIQTCPQLCFGPCIPRAQKLLISDCQQLLWRDRQGVHGVEVPSTSAPVTQLVVENCNVPQPNWSLLQHLPGLQSLTIKNCDIIEIPPEYLSGLTSLRELAIDGCKSIKSLPESIHQLTNLKVLCIWECPDLKTWCELVANKEKLACIGPKYEKFAPFMPAEQPPQGRMNVSVQLEPTH
ncbi:uncharacterized protein [Aegilops tauschii subsp. strangulata]|nr:putative disease resistance protein RGA3 [Aegilops tauschii subsp. strangulata]